VLSSSRYTVDVAVSKPGADVITLALVGLALVGLALAIVRARRGRDARTYVVATVGAVALAATWSVASLAGIGGRIDVSRPGDAVHEHLTDGDAPRVTGSLSEQLFRLAQADLATTEEERQTAAILVSATQQATRRYAPISSAASDNYVSLAGAGDPGALAYLYDRDFVREGTWLDPGRPQALVYIRTEEDTYKLIGAAYLAPSGEGPRLGGRLTTWYPHGMLCLDAADEVVAQSTTADDCPPNDHALAWRPEVLHVWLFDNPNGPFAGELTQEAADVAKLEGAGQ